MLYYAVKVETPHCGIGKTQGKFDKAIDRYMLMLVASESKVGAAHRRQGAARLIPLGP